MKSRGNVENSSNIDRTGRLSTEWVEEEIGVFEKGFSKPAVDGDGGVVYSKRISETRASADLDREYGRDMKCEYDANL
ncbi:hypothetical protein HAX54_051583 [Datura stramonium]|uniref:Uncharacterized protein n=1 Tax=Datura stramonium TaxID=4076 RepID=A0ABS8WQ25_DATST|nr:hypothetical protein [Datura stramonium]